MPGIDYNAIVEAVRTAISEDADFLLLDPVPTVYVEPDQEFGPEHAPFVAIYFISRRPTPNQKLVAYTQREMEINFTLFVGAASFDSPEVAIEHRNDVLSVVEVALMRTVTFRDLNAYTLLDGGIVTSGRAADGRAMAEGEIQLRCVSTITTT